MAIISTDIKYRLSAPGASAGNTAAATIGDGRGNFVSTTEITSATLHNVFTKISGSENANSQTDYCCIFVYNSHATLTLQTPAVWISAEVAGGATVEIGVDTTAASTLGSSSAQALTIASDTTAPAGVSFSAPTTFATGLALGDIPAGYVKAFWIKRIAANTAALAADGATFSVQGSTAA